MKKLYTTTILITLLSINIFAQAPYWDWAKRAGGTSDDRSYSTCTDVSGNVFITGYFQSNSITFGTTTLANSSAGTNDFFIVKYNALGNVLWAKSVGGTGTEQGYGICTDGSGNVLVTGFFGSPTITFGTTTLTRVSGADIFIAKYDTFGNVLWAVSAGGTSADISHSISTDASGNVFITGWFTSLSITFGATTLTNAGAAGTFDVFIAKYDASGNALWAKSAGGTSQDLGWGISTDTSGNVFISGSFVSTAITFGTTTLTCAGSNDIFIVKYDSLGNVLWAKRAGGAYTDEGYSVSTDASGNVFMTGYFSDPSITFGTITLTNAVAVGQDIFVVKYDASGNEIWAKSAGGTGSDEGVSICTDVNGNVLVTGYFSSPSIILGTTTLTNAGGRDIFITKYDTTGNVLWALSSGGTTDDYGNSVCTDTSGNVYITGWFQSSSIPFGTTTLTCAGSNDVFLAKIDSSQLSVGKTEIAFKKNGIIIYPNPFTSQTTISFSAEQRNTTIIITDILGKVMKTINFTGRQLIIEKENIKAGIYFVQTTDEKKNVTNNKIVMQ